MADKLTIREPDEELPDEGLPHEHEALYRTSDVPDSTSPPVRRHAAVLAPLLFQGGEWHLLFIRRAADERDHHHSGQVAFPGGRREPDDADDVHTALREAHEEIGLEASRVRVLGTLSAYVTISRYRVVPVVAVIDGSHALVLQPSEVAHVFTIPLSWLRRRDNLRLRRRGGADTAPARTHPVVVYDPYHGETLWGATARMTLNLLRAIDEGAIVLPVRDEHEPHPPQAS